MLEFNIDDRKFKRRTARFMDVLTNTSPIMRKVSGEMLAAVETNFRMEGRPRWAKLRPKTIQARIKKKKWPGKILQVSSAGLASSVHASHNRIEAIVGTNRTYAKYLQFGTKDMKARPFLKLTEQDYSGIKRLVKFEITHDIVKGN